MALTLTQELNIIKGNIKPPSNDLLSLLYQAAIGQALTFFSDYKDFDPEQEPDAAKYLGKVQAIGRRVFEGDKEALNAIQRVFVSIIGGSYNYNQVEAATDTQWETIIIALMKEVFEILGRTTKEEVTAYNAI